MEPEPHEMAKSLPGLGTPWPNPRKYAVTRRLLALWRWEWERGEHSEAAKNARRSLENRVAALGIEVL